MSFLKQGSESKTATPPHPLTRVAPGRAISPISNLLLSLLLFGLALLPRAYDLPRFVTADEAKWVYRSAQFLAALLRADFPATSVNLTPAVTTTWLGSLGLMGYYQLNQSTLNLPLVDWLNTLPEFRVALEVLVATRWAMVILTSLGVVALYHLSARLFEAQLAFLAAVFVALDPHSVALARILGHDAPTAVFMVLSLLLLLWANLEMREEPVLTPWPRPAKAWFLIILSGSMAGLAFLSKAPALFLIPFAGLVLVFSGILQAQRSAQHPLSLLPRLLFPFLGWCLAAYLAFVVGWPAAWIDALGRPAAVFTNAFISATDQEEADQEGFWRVTNLGSAYYLVNGGFKLSPLVLVGAGLALVLGASRRASESALPAEQTASPVRPAVASPPLQRVGSSPRLWLWLFVLLFTLFMTASDKRSPRYILPIFPVLAIIAADGWLSLYRLASSRVAATSSQGVHFRPYLACISFIIILTLSALIILWPYAPYYFTYFNPLWGGALTAPGWVKIGWGEGLDQVGRWLQQQESPQERRVGTPYASTVAPFFSGSLSDVTGRNLDYVVLYLKQVQSGEPLPEFVRYYEHLDPSYSVELNGLPYAAIYPGPALQKVSQERRPTSGILQPLGFRPLTPYGHLGETLQVEVVWPAADPLPSQPVMVTLAPIAALETAASSPAAASTVLAQGEGSLTRRADDLVVSSHRLALPADLEPGPYALLVAGWPLGEVDLRRFKVPPNLNRLQQVVFGQQVELAAFALTSNPDYIGVTTAWQARQSHLPDYTVFVQVLNAETGERLAGVDSPPLKGAWPTSRWVKDEVVVDEVLVAVPSDFPAGFYKVIIGLYRADTGQRLVLPDGQDHWTLPWTLIRK
jgi:hypothetical protein